MRLLDLFCCAGGAAMGYHRAGFTEIVGVDIRPQKRYPFTFIQADALEYVAAHGAEFDAIHASPVCKGYTDASKVWRAKGREYPDQIGELRRLLVATGLPYVIENVKNAPLLNPCVVNGGMFGLNVHRTRYFETSFPMPFALLPTMPAPVKMGRPIAEGDIIQPVGHFSGVEYAGRAMGIDWMTQAELSQAIPPAFTEFIGRHLIAHLTKCQPSPSP